MNTANNNTNSLFARVDEFIDHHALIKENDHILIGLSGGPDSIFLLHVLAHKKAQGLIRVTAVHINHEWRANAHEDVALCTRATQDLDIPLIVYAKSDWQSLPTKKSNGSREAQARHMRRAVFEKVAQELGCTAIALAHHLQDQQETFFIRLIRGSSLTGLAAMRPRHGMYVRPLLEINKADILRYLADQSITFVQDPTNISDNFLRNRIRKTVIPALESCDDRFHANFVQTINRLQQTKNFLEEYAQRVFAEITRTSATGTLISIDQLLHVHHEIQYRVLIHWLCLHNVAFTPTQALFDEIIRFLHNARDNEKQHYINQYTTITTKDGYAGITHTPR